MDGLVCFRGATCRPPCFNDLGAIDIDKWGAAWDSVERGPSTFATAKVSCEAKGARLPTATELFRVNAKKVGGVAGATENNLWSLTPNRGGVQEVIRLLDGAGTMAAVSSSVKYRCICPSITPRVFAQAACHGDVPGNTCYALNAHYNMDSEDRAATSFSGALWECQFVHAHLARLGDYLLAIPTGLPNGSSGWLHIADGSDWYNSDHTNGRVRWQGTKPTLWRASSNVLDRAYQIQGPFRCVGLGVEPADHHIDIVDAFVATNGGQKADSTHAPAATWPDSLDACWDKGGHLARAAEIQELIYQGLVAEGKDARQILRTADSQGTAGYTLGISWAGSTPSSSHTFTTRANKYSPSQQAYRCIYYPIDDTYQPPVPSKCNATCIEFRLGSGKRAPRMWFDSHDRLTATLSEAATDCGAAGGRLATERDMIEAIRHGLPNGLNTPLMTAEISADRYVTVRWTGIDKSFADTANQTSYTSFDSARPYRCVWTNELR